jgi:hypothetical protein
MTITGTSGSLTHTANVSLTVMAVVTINGTLTGSVAKPVSPVQLTQEGTLDWAHWGLAAVTDFNHKSGVTPQISNYALVGGIAPRRFANGLVGFTWTDGTPAPTATATPTGVLVSGQNNGFQITVPADTNLRTLRVYVGVWGNQGNMAAQLSDGSAPVYTDASLTNTGGSTTFGVYTFRFNAISAGQRLTVTYTVHNPGTGTVWFSAASLQ